MTLNNEPALHVYTDDEEYVVAYDEADALLAYKEDTKAQLDPDEEPIFVSCDDGKPFTYHDESDGPVTKTFGEWARCRGRGYFASRDF